jgi:hypothetical protein
VFLVALSLVAGWQIVEVGGLALSPDDYNLAGWEMYHLPDKLLFEIGRLVKGDSSPQDKDARIERYLALQSRVAELEGELNRQSATSTQTDALEQQLQEARSQRDQQKIAVEGILEERISAVASEQGLETALPLFSRVHWLFPPVDFEFADPPYVLVISPRDRIVEEKATLLRSDLTVKEAERLEQDAEAKSDIVSALVVPTGGIGAYPAIIEPSDNYLDVLYVASHEWLHDYLFFHPLGARYFENDTLRTINETVADIAGQEIGDLVAQRYPLPSPTPAPSPTPGPSPTPAVDADAVLRQLRLDVDQLLSEGKISEAEALMEQQRQYLAANGYFIRKINQAYFAFYGLYGTSGASSSPIGPKLEELRKRSPTLGDFVRAVSTITNEGDLDRLLAAAENGATQP